MSLGGNTTSRDAGSPAKSKIAAKEEQELNPNNASQANSNANTQHGIIHGMSAFDEARLQQSLFKSWAMGQKLSWQGLGDPKQKVFNYKNSLTNKYKTSYEMRERLSSITKYSGGLQCSMQVFLHEAMRNAFILGTLPWPTLLSKDN